MYPVLLKIGAFTLYSCPFFYNLIIPVCAIPFALEMERFKWKIPPVPFFLKSVPKSWQGTYYFDALIMACVGMAVGYGGAYLLYGVSTTLIQAWGRGYSALTWLVLFGSNLSDNMWFGGLLAGLFALRYYTKKHGVTYLQMIDLVVFGLILGQVPGRIGCFLGGCCYGKPSTLPWAFPQDSKFSLMMYPPGTPLHPSQLYECVIALGIFLYMWLRRKNNVYVGQNFVRYFILTGIARFFTEMVRADTPRGVYFEWLSVSQIVGLGCALVGAIFHFWIVKRKVSRVAPVPT